MNGKAQIAVRQQRSGGDSCPDVQRAALAAAHPEAGLTWLDIGCGNGALLRMVRHSHQPLHLTGLDILDWLDDDLRQDVDLIVAPADEALAKLGLLVDRVVLVETLEHLEAPWTVLREAARCVAPGGRIIVTTPNIASFRHRIELFARGRLTAFRPDNLPHMTPVLAHVVERVLIEEGMVLDQCPYAGRDIIPLTGGRHWPRSVHKKLPRATSVSVMIGAHRPLT
jgi:2-polyprenyl-3-methyl-5-hydroxy-6-metoxy-1,4-benzoquinol methylase